MAEILPRRLTQSLVIVVVLAVLVGAGLYFLLPGSTRRVTAHFSSAVGIYPNTDVRMLGVKIGKVTSVKPAGSTVTIKMEYDSKYKLPSNAAALVVSSSLVSERYIQLAPTYTGGPVLADNGDIPENRTAAPAELDQIYSALNQLSVALGPNGANKNGALSDLLKVAAANLGGNGQALGQSITNLSAAARTLADGREDLFGTVANLQTFTKALAQSDKSVRSFNDQLAVVSQQLADERQSLADALTNLTAALKSVAGFVKDNQAVFHDDVHKLVLVTNVLQKRQGALDEVLSVAPVAVANLAHTYNPASGTLDNRSNLNSLVDPGTICATLFLATGQTVLNNVPIIPGVLKSLSDVCSSVLGPVSSGLLQPILKQLGLGGLLTIGNSGSASSSSTPAGSIGKGIIVPGVTG